MTTLHARLMIPPTPEKPLGTDAGFGPRLTGEQYDAALVGWHDALDDERLLRRVEHDLSVQYRLASLFPKERSDRLFEAMKCGRKLALLFMAPAAIVSFVSGRPKGRVDPAGMIRRSCSKVLNDRELELWLAD